MVTFAPITDVYGFRKNKEQFAVMDQYMKLYHVDIMDGHFCKNMALTRGFLRSFREHTNTDIDIHLMTTNPSDWIEMCLCGRSNLYQPARRNNQSQTHSARCR